MALPNGWQTPKTTWSQYDFLDATSLNRIEGNINAIEQGVRTINQSATLSSANVNLSDFVDYVATLIKKITGESSWINDPATNLSILASLVQIDNLDFCRRFLYHAVTDYRQYSTWTGYSFSGSSLFSGVVMAKGVLVFIPDSASYAFVYNPATNQYNTISVNGGSGYWKGGAVYGNNVYCAPHNSDKMLVLNVNSMTASYISIPSVGASSARFWGAVTRGTKIYFIPYCATCVLIYDTETSSFSTVGSISGTNKFIGGAIAQNSIYCAPYDASYVLKIDASNNLSNIGSLSGSAKYAGATASLDESILWCAPYNSGKLLKITVASGTLTEYSISVPSQGFMSILTLPNGKFLAIPYLSSYALYFSDQSNTSQISVGSSSGMSLGATIWLDGRVFLAPYSVQYIGKIYATEGYTVFDGRT